MRDWFADAFGSAIADVRQKVVERGWFGEVVTPHPYSNMVGSLGDKSPSEQLGWSRGKGDHAGQEQARATSHDRTHGQEIDR